MRITRLYMKKFIAIYITQQKHEIEIIFPEDKMIHILYGPMGSGKTFILGHCQPWHTFGTLDVRNNDQQILPEEDGKKIIEYQKRDIHYIITHDYIWNGKSHNTKHYIKKDGIELNSNGNLTSFNDIIKIEFGIDQDYMRLLRIGDNVGNVIKLKATERKRYIASRLTETDTWLLIYKKISQDLRSINSQVDMISRNLSNLHFDQLEDMEEKMEELSFKLEELSKYSERMQAEIYHAEGRIQSMMNDMTFTQFENLFRQKKDALEQMSLESSGCKMEMSELSNELKPEELKMEIGKLDGALSMMRIQLVEKSNQFNTVQSSLSKLEEEIALQNNEEQLSIIEGRYQSLLSRIKELEEETKWYIYEESFETLMGLNNDVEEINRLIYALSSYQEEDLVKIYHSDRSIVSWADKKVQILEAKKRKSKDEANNYQFSMSYTCSFPLFIPPFCPTEDCPYRKTHPITVRGDSKKSEIEALVQRKLTEAGKYDIEIYRYLDYSTIFNQMSQLKMYWKKSFSLLKKLKVLKEESLDLIITKNRNWIDGDKLIHWMSLARKKAELFNLRDKMIVIKDELNQMKIHGIDDLKKRQDELIKEKLELLSHIEQSNFEMRKIEGEIKSLNDRYLKVSNLSIIEKRYEETIRTITSLKEEIIEKENIINSVQEYKNLMIENQKKILINQEEYGKTNEEYMRLRDLITRIHSLKDEYKDILRKQTLYSYITEAVSPKEGIPLEIVSMYLNSCRDVINDLISDVFDDNLEIERFNVTEDDFTIPYIVGGKVINDVSRCSQGEKSIIGIAISFAMMQDTNVEYNIPLLDEVDGPLHGSDRNKFFILLSKWIKRQGIEQIIDITHNQFFEGYPINLILTSDEDFKDNEVQSVYRI